RHLSLRTLFRPQRPQRDDAQQRVQRDTAAQAAQARWLGVLPVVLPTDRLPRPYAAEPGRDAAPVLLAVGLHLLRGPRRVVSLAEPRLLHLLQPVLLLGAVWPGLGQPLQRLPRSAGAGQLRRQAVADGGGVRPGAAVPGLRLCGRRGLCRRSLPLSPPVL